MNGDFLFKDAIKKEIISPEALEELLVSSINNSKDKPLIKDFIDIQKQIERIKFEFVLQKNKLNEIYNSILQNLLDQQNKLLEKISFSKNLWRNSLSNHHKIGKLITKEDFNILQYLKNIEHAEFIENKSTKNEYFTKKLIFYFEKNPFFQNETIEKRIFLNKDNTIERVASSKIDWFPNKDLTKSVIKKKVKSSSNNEIKEVEFIKGEDSFFNYFETIDFPSKDKLLLFKKEEEYDLISYFINEERVYEGIVDIINHKFEYFFGLNKLEGSELENYYEEMINKLMSKKERK